MIRRLIKKPGFTALTLLTLAIGIGANTAIFSLINGVLLKPLPFADSERLASLRLNARGPKWMDMELSPAVYFLLREQSKTLEHVALWRDDRLIVNGIAEPEQVDALDVTPSLLRALKVTPLAGRALTDKDGEPGSPPAAMISYAYLSRRFAGNPSNAIGKRISLDLVAYEIVGVLPQSFQFLNTDPLVVVPLQFDRSKAKIDDWFFPGVARLKPGVSWQQANAEVAQLLPQLPDGFPMSAEFSRKKFEAVQFEPSFRPLKEEVVGNVGFALWIVMATVGLVLLIACANVTNLLLVRTEGRQQELAIRMALGASRARLTVDLLTESVLLSLLGGALALGVAYAAIRFLVYLSPPSLPRLGEVAIDPVVFLFSFAVSLVVGILVGLIPVWKYVGARIEEVLRSGGRAASAGRDRRRARAVLVIAQVTLASVLLVSAGLMIRTFYALTGVDPGFRNPDQVLTASLALTKGQVESNDRLIAIYQEMVRKVEAVPGVRSAAIGWGITLDGTEGTTYVFVEGREYKDGEVPPDRRYKVAGPGFFRTMGNPLIAGRDFTWTDMHDRTFCAIVSESFARELWGDPVKALGKRIREAAYSPWREIIGVVGDERDDGLNKPAAKTIHWPLAMRGYRGRPDEVRRYTRIVVRGERAGSEAFLKEVKSAIWSVEPTTPVAYVRTLKQIMGTSIARTSFALTMLTIAGGMALLLVITGVYGVVAYSVSQRTREIGIRTALGATSRDIRTMILRHALVLGGLGALIGLGASFAVTRTMSSLLYRVSPTDIWTLVAVPVVLAGTVLLASYVPAQRAVRIQPVVALRVE